MWLVMHESQDGFQGHHAQWRKDHFRKSHAMWFRLYNTLWNGQIIETENRLVVGVIDGGRCVYAYKEGAQRSILQ